MKLVDILARKLKEWPEGLECLSQLQNRGSIINGKGFDGRVWNWLEIAEDTLPAGVIVTRAQWQAAVDALKADDCAHSEGNKQGCPECGEAFAAEWNGIGLPPVGSTCEVRGCGSSRFCKASVLFCQDNVLVISWEGEGVARATNLSDVQIRTIQTPEQIAAEKEISDMIDDAMDGHMCLTKAQAEIVCAQLHKAGYRKQESEK